MGKDKPSSIPVRRARPKKLKDLPHESTINTIFPNRSKGRWRANNGHRQESSFMGVKKGDRNEFKSLDLERSVRVRQRNDILAKPRSRRDFKQPDHGVPAKKFPMASDNVYPSMMPTSKAQWGPGTAPGFAGGGQCSAPILGAAGTHNDHDSLQSANMIQSGTSASENCSFPLCVGWDIGSSFDGSAATSSWSGIAEDLQAYQDKQEPCLGCSVLEMGYYLEDASIHTCLSNYECLPSFRDGREFYVYAIPED
ncbi:hypothetical protein M413DRAFT_444733 [Hebeloma cylindrosporum]|uniref:Uncharacterized protein n=1 Tax=Hebeloma cylindrosporum TaxID=76867 RepID=A0A0C3CFA9_HEBCY|nr:hypothetical protein M413DRAFT_444733 [Hebeloma cylindrosporum h7]